MLLLGEALAYLEEGPTPDGGAGLQGQGSAASSPLEAGIVVPTQVPRVVVEDLPGPAGDGPSLRGASPEAAGPSPSSCFLREGSGVGELGEGLSSCDPRHHRPQEEAPVDVGAAVARARLGKVVVAKDLGSEGEVDAAAASRGAVPVVVEGTTAAEAAVAAIVQPVPGQPGSRMPLLVEGGLPARGEQVAAAAAAAARGLQGAGEEGLRLVVAKGMRRGGMALAQTL